MIYKAGKQAIWQTGKQIRYCIKKVSARKRAKRTRKQDNPASEQPSKQANKHKQIELSSIIYYIVSPLKCNRQLNQVQSKDAYRMPNRREWNNRFKSHHTLCGARFIAREKLYHRFIHLFPQRRSRKHLTVENEIYNTDDYYYCVYDTQWLREIRTAREREYKWKQGEKGWGGMRKCLCVF